MSIRPEDLLPDGKNSVNIGGREIRKGTMGAFLSNIDIIENPIPPKKKKPKPSKC